MEFPLWNNSMDPFSYAISDCVSTKSLADNAYLILKKN